MEQVNAGMRVASSAESTIPAITRQFVAWCREEASITAGLPNVSELAGYGFTQYCRKRGLHRMRSHIRVEIKRALLAGYQPGYQNMRANALTRCGITP